MRYILTAAFLLFSATLSAAPFNIDVDYKKIALQKTDVPGKIEVIEFFWYGCPHCSVFDPFIDTWKKTMPKNVNFIRVPVPLNPSWGIHSKTYYALQIMGLGEKHHNDLFNEIHTNKNKLSTISEISKFLASKGVDKKEFLDAFNSFATEGNVRKAIKKMNAYKVDGVPMMAVNGKYLVTGKMAGSYQRLIDIVNYLVALETIAPK